MRILQLVNSLEYGGLERLVVQLTAELQARRHEVLIGCLERAGSLAAEAQRRGLRVVALEKRPGLDWWLVPRLASLLRAERIEVVHAHNMGPLVYGALAARLAGCAAVNTRHGREDKRLPGWLWALTAQVVAISEDARRRLLQFNRIAPARVGVVYNGIDSSARNGHVAALEDPLSFVPTGRRLIGTVGRLAPEKDHATLLRALRILVERGVDAHLLIAGDGALRAALERLSSEVGVADRVSFLGFRADIEALMDRVEVFTLSSLTEGIPLTLLEAMAAGTPVVVTRVGGMPEVVTDGETGLLVPAREPQELAEALGRVLADAEFARRLGDTGRQRVEAQFSLRRMTDDYETLYARTGHH